MLQILSFGGGVNTAAILALAYKGELKVDYAIFADTGCEYPDTYRWIEEIAKPIFKHLNIEFVRIVPQVEGTDNLYDYCWKWKIVPLRNWRICTDKFKIRPIKKWRKENLNGMDYDFLIGFDSSESHRVKIIHGERYPLIELGYNRKDCKRLIKSVDWSVPPKSGCYLCPFSRMGQWKKLYEVHPNLYTKTEALEKRSRKYPDNLLAGHKSLEEIRLKLTNSKQQNLDTWGDFERDGFDRGCGMCHV